MIQGLIPAEKTRFFSFWEHLDWPWGPPTFLFSGFGCRGEFWV